MASSGPHKTLLSIALSENARLPDGNVPMLSRMFGKRLRGYAAIGYQPVAKVVIRAERRRKRLLHTAVNGLHFLWSRPLACDDFRHRLLYRGIVEQ